MVTGDEEQDVRCMEPEEKSPVYGFTTSNEVHVLYTRL